MSINSIVKAIKTAGKTVTLIGSDLTLEGAARITKGFLIPVASIKLAGLTPKAVDKALNTLSVLTEQMTGERFVYMVRPSGKTGTMHACVQIFPVGIACYLSKAFDAKEYFSIATGNWFEALSKAEREAKAEKASK